MELTIGQTTDGTMLLMKRVFENISQESGKVIFSHKDPLSEKVLAGHTTSPTFVDWNKDGVWEIFVGAEDGHFYHFQR